MAIKKTGKETDSGTPELNPSAGGRYIRQADGTLTPADQAQAQPLKADSSNQPETEKE
jgi:hypothetical protein